MVDVTKDELQNSIFDQTHVTDDMRSFSKIKRYFPDNLIKLFYYYALNYELGNNNKKAELFEYIMKSYFGSKFVKLGTGTNRIAFRRGNFVYKIALDRRGIIDNLSEAKRSPEAPNLFALTYETNGLIVVAEYVTLIDEKVFNDNQQLVLEMLSELAKQYIFGDMGFSSKNYCNFGYRRNNKLVVLDYAYCHPRFTNEDIMVCPQCGSEIRYNAMFTGFRCSNPNCGIEYSYIDIKRRLDTSYENIENMYMSNLALLDVPDLEHIAFDLNLDNDFIKEYSDAEGQKVPIRNRHTSGDKKEVMTINIDE